VEVGGQVIQATAEVPLPAWLHSRGAGDPVALVLRADRARPLEATAAEAPRAVALGSAPDGRRQS
jgi:hypothetical protein